MEELNAFYNRLLLFGLIVLREAIYAHNDDWTKAEIEMLHNLPSLVGEQNVERHRYFWFVERDVYIQRVLALENDEPKSRMRMYYEPIWHEMEPVLLGVLGEAVQACREPVNPTVVVRRDDTTSQKDADSGQNGGETSG